MRTQTTARRLTLAFLGMLCLSLAVPAARVGAFILRDPSRPQFTGSWAGECDGYVFSLTLWQNGDRLTGSHSATLPNGRRVDATEMPDGRETSIRGTVDNTGATVKFRSGYDANAGGTARLVLSEGRLLWEVNSSHGDEYLPHRCMLIRQKPEPRLKPDSLDLAVSPGRLVGRVELGLTPAEVHARIGAPDETRTLPGGLTVERWIAHLKHPVKPISTSVPKVSVIYREGSVAQVEVTSARFKLAEGLSTESSLEEIQREFKRARVSNYEYSGYTALYVDDVKQGIAFKKQASGAIKPEDRPDALVVHAPGTPVLLLPGGKPISTSPLDASGS